MPHERQQYGQSSERLAVEFLERRGYTIVARNYRTRLGEIDIIARHNGAWVFVEVKARRSGRFGDPKAALTPTKQRKISMAALAFLKSRGGTQTKARFDVVTVRQVEGQPHVELIANAFDLAYA